MLFLQIYSLLGVAFILACAKWGDWKNWRLYYPTIVFLMFGAIMFDFLAYCKLLTVDKNGQNSIKCDYYLYSEVR